MVPFGGGETLRKRSRALERVLASGKDVDRIDRVLRTLRHRIEPAKRLDVVAEELDTDGYVGGRRIHVEDPATAREAARLGDLGDGLVPEVEEPRRGLVPRDTIAGAQRAPALSQVRRCDRVLHQRAQRSHDRERLDGGM